MTSLGWLRAKSSRIWPGPEPQQVLPSGGLGSPVCNAVGWNHSLAPDKVQMEATVYLSKELVVISHP